MGELAVKTCRSCHQPIVLVYSESTGRRMPLDAVATTNGNVIVAPSSPLDRPLARVFASPEAAAAFGDRYRPALLRYTSHHSTCTTRRRA